MKLMAEEREREAVIQTIDYLPEVDAEEPEDRKRLEALRARVVEHVSAQQSQRPAQRIRASSHSAWRAVLARVRRWEKLRASS